MKINPIETRYAGCRFRSRLEARWAVFFDKLDIKWEYESQGFECQARLTFGHDPIPYLPDFWLPDLGIFGEVKGDLDTRSLTRLLDIAASLSANNGGGCHDNGGNDLVVFGTIPNPTIDGALTPTRLHMHKGDLQWSPWVGEPGDCCAANGTAIAADYGGDDIYNTYRGPGTDVITHTLLRGISAHSLSQTWRDAYAAARSARFEHGESG
jgi:hypothetical protein